MSIVDWAALKTTDIGSRIDEQTLVILPIGAVEQHGPHLPLGTDSLILEGLLARLRGRTLERGRALVMPLVPVGYSPEHRSFPGTLTVAAETLIALWLDLARAAAAHGARRFVLLNSHGGNSAPAQVAIMRMRDELELAAALLTTHRLGTPAGMVEATEARYGIHAGHTETALTLAIAGELVDMTAARDFHSRERDLATPRVSYTGAVVRQAWRSEELHPSGAVGNAAAATATDGARLLDHLCETTLAALDDLLAMPLPPLSR